MPWGISAALTDAAAAPNRAPRRRALRARRPNGGRGAAALRLGALLLALAGPTGAAGPAQAQTVQAQTAQNQTARNQTARHQAARHRTAELQTAQLTPAQVPATQRPGAPAAPALLENGLIGDGLTAAPITLYIDPQGGDDAASGASPDQARRTPPEVVPPGRRLLFKGGSVWPRRLVVASGDPGAPVIYDGNGGAEGFGTGRARLDGTRPLGPWTPAGRTPEGLAIWKTEAPGPVPALDLAVFQDGERARIAASADLQNNWVEAEFDLYHAAPRAALTKGRLTDPQTLALYGREGWAHAALRVHEGANWLNAYPVRRWIAQDGAAAIPGATPLKAGKQVRYAVLNHPDVFDRPGEFRVVPPQGVALNKAAGWNASGGTLFYIPLGGVDPNAVQIRYAQVETAIDAGRAEHAVIRGFRITGHRRFAVDGGSPRRQGPRLGPLRIEDNVIRAGGAIRIAKRRGAEVIGNRIARTLEFRPIHLIDVNRGRVEGNRIAATPSGITLYRTVNSLVKNNDVRRITDVHGNALTVYDGSHNTWLVGNALVGRRGITLRDNDRVVVAFNRIRASRFALAQWAESPAGERLWIFNNDLHGAVLIKPRTARLSEFRNNFAGRLAMPAKGRQALRRRSHNLWDGNTRHARSVQPQELAQGEGYLPFDKAFPRREGLDLRPSSGTAEAAARGLPYAVLGVEVGHIGAHLPGAGPLPDLSGIGLPPPDPDAAAGRRPARKGQAAGGGG
ncbi:MAG: NosD domain-containing protein [Pseudomonadota bacterium]